MRERSRYASRSDAGAVVLVTIAACSQFLGINYLSDVVSGDVYIDGS